MSETVKPRSWVEIKLEVPDGWVEGVSNFLIELGSPGVVQESALRGKKECILAYLPNRPSYAAKRMKLKKYLASLRGQEFFFKQRVIQGEKWAENWKSNFRPFHATPKIVVKPPWEEYSGKRGERVITIDPGMAFGTGTHPTTQLCLRALEERIPAFSRSPSVLDFGTGSGILAIGAQKLGAKKIVAVDIDPLAVENARKNAAVNGLKGRIDFWIHPRGKLRRVFDLVVANLLPQELLRAAPFLARRVSAHGLLVLSGILRGQKEEISSAFTGRGFKVISSKEKRGWVCLTLNKRRAGSKEQRARSVERRAEG